MSDDAPAAEVQGLMFIGDPHLESRVPGFRKDDFPQVALEKLRWCLQFAVEQGYQPFLLGDLFQLPQDNPNWLISAVIQVITETLGAPLPAIYGNHDVRENSLKPNDSIHILFTGGQLRHVSASNPWMGKIADREVRVAGTVWGEKLPRESPFDSGLCSLTVWMTHHDIFIPGYEEGGRIRPKELPGIDLVVNGHIHRRLQTVCKESTYWMTPGNITRRTRGDASRAHRPSVLIVAPLNAEDQLPPEDVFNFTSRSGHAWRASWLEVPHASFDDVFHPQVVGDDVEEEIGSGFIADLRELTSRRTDTGAGLAEFLDVHLPQLPIDVADEIRRLAVEVNLTNERTKHE